MKKHLLLTILLVSELNWASMDKGNPGCVRQNSDEIRRDLLFMHIQDGHWDLLNSLLDHQTIHFTDRSGKGIIEKLFEVAQAKGIDISEPLKHLETVHKRIKTIEKS